MVDIAKIILDYGVVAGAFIFMLWKQSTIIDRFSLTLNELSETLIELKNDLREMKDELKDTND